MRVRSFAAAYAIIMGISIIGIWIVFFLTDSVPEIRTKPVELGAHIIAEYLTAILLIIGGVGLIAKKNWAYSIHLVSMGMLLYTLVMSPGYFAERGEVPFVAMFAAFFVIGAVLTFFMVKRGPRSKHLQLGE